MKKLLFLFVLITGLTVGAYAAPGDAVGSVYSTDIVADIDGMAVPSYNIGGKTVVIAEELEPYGFEVIWNENERTLSVNTKAMPEVLPDYVPQKAAVSGMVAGTIYETDIVSFVNGMPVESYNIGGKTALVMEDMASEDDEAKRISRDMNPHRALGYSVALMKAYWNSEVRTISLYTIRPGSKLGTAYGEVTVKDISREGYHNGSYAFYGENGEPINMWVNNVHYNGEVYMSVDDLTYSQNEIFQPVFEGLSAALSGKTLLVNIPPENIRSVLYTNAGTVGACTNNLLTLSETLSVNGVASQTETPDFILYGGTVYVGENALNSALGQKAVSYKYELPEACTEHIDDTRESRVIVYINDRFINSFNTLDGTCYLSARDLESYGFSVGIEGNRCAITSPQKAVSFKQEGEYPETYWWGEVDESIALYPIYNGIYDVTVDQKPIEDVFVHTTLVFRAPCISAEKLAELAGYRLDTSDPLAVRIYTE